MPWAIAVALWWLLPAGVAPVGLVGVPFACEVGRCACGSGACWALCRQTAGCNAGTAGADGYRAWCNRPAEYWKHCKGLKAGKRQAWTPIRSHCCGRGDALSHCCGLVVAFACGRARGMDALTTERYAGKRPARHFRGFKGLKAGKRQAWTPIRSHCCGRGDALSDCCGLVVAFACGRARGMDALTTERYAGKRPARHFRGFKGLKAGKRQAWTPIRSHCCGRGDALSHCCGLVVAFACGRARGMDALTTERYAGKRPARHFRGFKGLKAGKRQAWTPIRSHCCGRGDALSHCCGLVVAFACGRARGMDALTTERHAGKRPARHFRGFKGLKAGKRQPWTPIRSHCCGRGDALSHCCGLVVAFACGRARGMDALTTERYSGKRPARHFRGCKGLKFEACQTAALNA